MLVAALGEHRLASPRSELGLVFPNDRDGVDHRNSIVYRGFHPAQVAAGVVDQHGGAKYKGLHALRHFYASWCINRRVDGGLDRRLGHQDLDAIFLDVFLRADAADGRLGAVTGEERAGALRVPGAALVVPDDAAPRGEDRLTGCVPRLLGDEVDELEQAAQGCSTLSICARWSLPE